MWQGKKRPTFRRLIWAMIRRVYGRWMPDAAPEAGRRAEALFGGADEKSQNDEKTA